MQKNNGFSVLLVGLICIILLSLLSGSALAASLDDEALLVVKSGAGSKELLKNTGKIVDKKTENYAFEKFTNKLSGIKKLNLRQRKSINNFVVYGTGASQSLGANERVNLIMKYYKSAKKLPKTKDDWRLIVGEADKQAQTNLRAKLIESGKSLQKSLKDYVTGQQVLVGPVVLERDDFFGLKLYAPEFKKNDKLQINVVFKSILDASSTEILDRQSTFETDDFFTSPTMSLVKTPVRHLEGTRNVHLLNDKSVADISKIVGKVVVTTGGSTKKNYNFDFIINVPVEKSEYVDPQTKQVILEAMIKTYDIFASKDLQKMRSYMINAATTDEEKAKVASSTDKDLLIVADFMTGFIERPSLDIANNENAIWKLVKDNAEVKIKNGKDSVTYRARKIGGVWY